METLLLRDGLKESTIRLEELEQFFTSYQGSSMDDRENCALCKLNLSEEIVHHVSKDYLIVDTKNKKGHKNRIMLVMKEHGTDHPKAILDQAILTLIEIGRRLFDSDFCLLSDKFSTVKNHWHIVASDFKGDDYEQIMRTPFILITNRRGSKWTASHVSMP